MELISQTTCPFLGLQADPASNFSEPVDEHRCYVTRRSQRIGLEHQRQFCLKREFEACPRFDPSAWARAPSAPSFNTDGIPPNGPSAPPPRLLFWLTGFLEETSLPKLGLWLALILLGGGLVYAYLAWLPTTSAFEPTEPSTGGATAPTSMPPPTATLAPGRRQAVIRTASDAVGWVSSADPANHLGDGNLYAGILEGQIYHGAMQFGLDAIPPRSRIADAQLELVGLGADDLAPDGTWALHLLGPGLDHQWRSITYDQIHNASTLGVIPPELDFKDLAEGKTNVFTFTREQRKALEQRLETGWVSFRLDGPSQGGNNRFAWGTGNSPPPNDASTIRIKEPNNLPSEAMASGNSDSPPTSEADEGDESFEITLSDSSVGGSRPVLHVIYMPPPTVTPIVVTATPSPANVLTVAARAATATYQATTVGTATAGPANVVTATPPLVITNTPTPGNRTTAEWVAAEATAHAFLIGTPTPLPPNAWTATPASLPLLIPLDQINNVTPTPIGTPTPIPTPTPTALPAALRGKIAFLSDRLGEPAVFVANPNGDEVALLTNAWAYERALELDAFSPDGRERLLVKEYQYGYEIWVRNTHDGSTRFLISTPKGSRFVYEPAWSPDDIHVAFVVQTGSNTELVVFDKDTQQVNQLTKNQWEQDRHPSWSPDGGKLVFWSDRGIGRWQTAIMGSGSTTQQLGQRQIWIMNADGSNQRPLFQDEWNNWDPVWFK